MGFKKERGGADCYKNCKQWRLIILYLITTNTPRYIVRYGCVQGQSCIYTEVRPSCTHTYFMLPEQRMTFSFQYTSWGRELKVKCLPPLPPQLSRFNPFLHHGRSGLLSSLVHPAWASFLGRRPRA
jgi:hypothetical protein